MRLLVLTYRLTKIKGVLVSVGVCALTNATMFLASAAGTAGLALVFSTTAQAGPPPTTPGCNASNGDGTITSSTGTSLLWTAPTVCTVSGTITMVNGDALTASGSSSLVHDSLTNSGYIHASLTASVLSGAYVAGLSNVVNVGSIVNSGGSTITGDYVGGSIMVSAVSPMIRPFATATGLAGPGNTFKIDGVNNQALGTVQSFTNDGLIQGTIDSGMGPDTVSQGFLVGFNNDGTIGTLTNSSVIQATLGSGVSRQSNNFSIVGLANSSLISTLTNSGTIDGDDVGILNGNIALTGPSILYANSATISQLTNSGQISGGSAAIENYGHMDTITNTGVIEAEGFGAIIVAPAASVNLLDNQAAGTIVGYGYAAIVNAGTISTLMNEGFIGTGGEGAFGIVNGGTIGALVNSGSITANVTAIVNAGGTIDSLTNSNLISGGSIGLANVYGTQPDSTIGSYGTIDSLVNTGNISGNEYGIYNTGSIGSLANQSYETISNGTITGGTYGIYNDAGGTIGTLDNSTGAVLSASAGTALFNNGSIGSVTNDGLIQGYAQGIQNQGTIGSIGNTLDGVITATQESAIDNEAQIGAISNDGLITAVVGAGIFNNSQGSIGSLTNSATGSIVSSATGALQNTAIFNRGQIGSLTNNGVITADGAYGAGIYNQGGTIGTLANSGSIGGGGTGVTNTGGEGGPGTITELDNSGVIHGGSTGIYNTGTIASLTNTTSGTVTGSILGGNFGIISYGQIGSIGSAGLISGYYVGIGNEGEGSIGTLMNAAGGAILAGYTGIYNSGQIGSVTNDGSISAQYYKGISNDVTGSIGSLTNSGQIQGGATGVLNYGVISTINNSGMISGDNDGIVNSPTGGEGGPGVITAIANSGYIGGYYAGIDNSGTINSLVNAQSGWISAGSTGIVNSGGITQLINSGQISGEFATGIENQYSGSIGTLSNLAGGTIRGGTSGIYNDDNATIGQLTNNGLIVGGKTGIDNEGAIGTLTNTGVITGGEYGVYNENVIGTLYNNGTISGATIGGTMTTYGIYNEYSITSLTNDRHGTISATIAVLNYGTIGALANSGAILGAYTGVQNFATIGALSNTGNTAVIIGDVAIDNASAGVIGSLINSGVISGRTTGIDNFGSITKLVNSGQITGATAGIYNSGAIASLNNQGLISGASVGLYNDYGGSIGTLSNAGTISSAGSAGIRNEGGTITSLVNSGHVSGVSAGISNFHGMIGALTNSGTIEGTGTISDGLYNSGSIVSLTNSGLIQGTRSGVRNDAATEPTVLGGARPLEEAIPSVIATLTNSSTGTISGAATGLYNAAIIGTLGNAGSIRGGGIGLNDTASGSITSMVNSGTITGTSFGLVNGGSIGSLDNSGTISDDSKAGIQNSGSLGTLTSSGLISGAIGLANTGGSIGSLDNSGTIVGTQSDGLYVDGTVGPVTNEGTISGAVNAIDIDASGKVATLSNSGQISAPTAIKVVEGGSLGLLTNSGKVAGNVVNASTNDLSIAGGSGGVFGTFTGFSGGLGVGDIGQITNTASSATFTSGNVLLNDHVNVGTGTVTNAAATLQVDNPIKITGNYLQSTAGLLSVGVASIANHGELIVSSAATVNAGGQVALTRLDGFRFAAGESFTLIDAGSAAYNVAGMEATAAGFSGGYLISEVKSGAQEDLVVCLTNRVKQSCDGGAFAYSLATTSNAIIANNAVGSYSGTNVALNKLADAVVALGTSPAANRAGNQLLADPHNNGAGLAMQPSLDVLNVVTGHTDSARLASNGGERGLSAGESGPGLATWGEAFGGSSHQSQDGQFSGYSMSSEGLVAGGDAAIADSMVRVGAVFTYTHADLHDHGDRTGDTLSLDSDGALVYATFLGDRAYADLLGGVMFDTFDTVRVVDITNFNGVSSGSHDGTQSVAKASGGYRIPMGGESSKTTLTPLWGVTYSHLHQDAYTETGGNGSALRVDGEGDNSLKGEVGLKLERNFAVSRGDLVPEMRVMYRHEFDNGAQLQTASFAADATETTFSTLNARPIVNSGLFSAGLNLLGQDGVTVTLKYTAEVATGYVSQGGSLRVRWAF